MNPARRQSLDRLLAPRHIAFIGGDSAAAAIEVCRRGGFDGEIWGVNPRRDELAGAACFASVDRLPAPPDAVFLAVPSEVAIEAVASCREASAGGIACYTAGFGETGERGRERERDLVAAAGDLALVGPNCSGLLNFRRRAHLWPFAHGGRPVERGAAFITQSGMLGNTVSMSERSVALAYVVSVGNQAVLTLEDFLEQFIDDAAVSVIGLYIEEITDSHRFSRLALAALRAGKPIVAQKAGTSAIGSRLVTSHTGALSGTGEAYAALFERLGIVQVRAPEAMMETLKLLTVAGPPRGRRVAGFTCSGGDATMLADGAQAAGLDFPPPSPDADAALRERLPPLATVSNPLDYTTPLWGDESALADLFAVALDDAPDAAVMVQDYPRPELATDNEPYFADARAFATATSERGIPGVVCSVLPENLDETVREHLAGLGLAPLQGIGQALDALGAAATCGAAMARAASVDALDSVDDEDTFLVPGPGAVSGDGKLMDEWSAKQLLRDAGLAVPAGARCTAGQAPEAADRIGYPVVLKAVSAGLAHKTDAGAVHLGLIDSAAVRAAVYAMADRIARQPPGTTVEHFLIEEMVEDAVAELLIGVRHDPRLGQTLTVASGGILAELVADARTLLLPASREAIADAIMSLRAAALLAGHRGGSPGDLEAAIGAAVSIAKFACERRDSLLELEVNPLLVRAEGAVVVDALIRTTDRGESGTEASRG